jgi:hypothetical protein
LNPEIQAHPAFRTANQRAETAAFRRFFVRDSPVSSAREISLVDMTRTTRSAMGEQCPHHPHGSRSRCHHVIRTRFWKSARPSQGNRCQVQFDTGLT